MTSNDFIELAHEDVRIAKAKDIYSNDNELIQSHIEEYANKLSVKAILLFAGKKIINTLLNILCQSLVQKLTTKN